MELCHVGDRVNASSKVMLGGLPLEIYKTKHQHKMSFNERKSKQNDTNYLFSGIQEFKKKVMATTYEQTTSSFLKDKTALDDITFEVSMFEPV